MGRATLLVLVVFTLACGSSSNGGGGTAGSGGAGGAGGMAGAGGNGGQGGTGGSAGDGGQGGAGGIAAACVDSLCPCTEPGIRAAIAEGGGPFTFDCDGPTTVVTAAEIVIDNDVILDGESELTVDGTAEHQVFQVTTQITAELRGVEVTGGRGSWSDIGNQGTLTVTNSTVSGRGIRNDGTLTVTNSTFMKSSTQAWSGIYNFGTVTVTNSTFWGADIANFGTAAVANSTLSRNEATLGDGAIHNRESGIMSLTNSTVSGNEGLGLENYGTMAVTNSTVSGNNTSLVYVVGGGIDNWGTLTVTNSTVSGNMAFDGGGIRNHGGATLSLTNSTVSGNTAINKGGGISNGTSAISGSIGTLSLTNSTVSGNTAGGEGGGIRNTGTLTLTNSTVSGNTALTRGSDLHNIFDGMATATNSLIDGDCEHGGAVTPITSTGYNIESPGDTCGFDQATDRVDVTEGQLNLGPLQDNGGLTMTRALLPGSVAIDVIPEAECLDADGAPLTTDQRGEPRPETDGTMCDVGAFEVQP